MTTFSDEALDLAERVLVVLARYNVAGDSHVAVEIMMSPHDMGAICAGGGAGGDAVAGLWGQRIVESGWVADGHPAVCLTVTA